MLDNITTIDFRIIELYTRDYSASFSIRQITKLLKINYSNAFKRVNQLIKRGILLRKKAGQANNISFNIRNMDAIKVISFVEEMESRKIKNSNPELIATEALQIDPFCCVGLFGSRVSGRATANSDWDIFIIARKEKRREIEKIAAKFPHAANIQLQVFSIEEFQESLLSAEETVIKHIVKNKQIIYNPHPFYSIIHIWEAIKYAPTQ